MTRANKVYEGTLMDKELFIIEDALADYKVSLTPKNPLRASIEKIIHKLYVGFYEREVK